MEKLFINPVPKSNKCKADLSQDNQFVKKQNTTQNISGPSPIGILWDSVNYSCAYDTLFSILSNIHSEDFRYWTSVYRQITPHLQNLSKGCINLQSNNNLTLEIIRNQIRSNLYNENPEKFPYGQVGTNIIELAYAMLVDNNSLSTQTITCTYCNSNSVNSLSDILIHLYNNFDNINKGFQYWQKHEGHKCNICQSQQTITRNISNSYNLFAFALEHSNIAINKTVQVQKPNNSFSLIPLKGIIYIGNNHFTARIIDAKKMYSFIIVYLQEKLIDMKKVYQHLLKRN